MAKNGNTIRRRNDFVDSTDGLPEDLPFIRIQRDVEPVYSFAGKRQTNQGYYRFSRWRRRPIKPKNSKERALSIFLASICALFLLGVAYYLQFELDILTSLGTNLESESDLETAANLQSPGPDPLATTPAIPASVLEAKATPLPQKGLPVASLFPEDLILPPLTISTVAEENSIRHVVGSGETLSTIIRRYKLDPSLSSSIPSSLKQLAQTDKSVSSRLPVGTTITFKFGKRKKIDRILVYQKPGEFIELIRRKDNSFKASLQQLPRQKREYIAVGRISSSLARDASKVGVSYDIIDDFVDLFSDRVVFHQDLHEGDSFIIIFENEVLEDGTLLGEGKIVAASLDLQGEKFSAIRYKGKDGKGRMFNEKGELIGASFLRYPLKFSRISSLFSDNRMHPVLGVRKPHNGVDFVAPVGTPIRSVANGVVESAGWAGACGKMVKIVHSPRYSTAYCHLSSITANIKAGVKVQRGQVIGGLGGTGRVTGPHLHYAFYDNQKFVDPIKMKLPSIDLDDPSSRIQPTYLSKAILTLDNYHRMEISSLYDQSIHLSERSDSKDSNDLLSVLNRYRMSIDPIITIR